MITYLITGGAGFIGSNFIHFLLYKYHEQNIHIINLDKLTYAASLDNLKDVETSNKYTFIKGDICDTKLVMQILSDYSVNYIVNFAAESHVDRSIINSKEFIYTNVLGTENLLNCANAILNQNKNNVLKKFLQISTDEVYGSLGTEGYFTEASPIEPHSPYSASKASADLIALSYYSTYKFPIVITRCSNNYGPRQNKEKLIPMVITRCLERESIPVYGTGENIRDWIFVLDHCEAIDLVLQNGRYGEIYNIGGQCEKKNIDLIYSIISKMGIEGSQLIKYVDDRKGHDFRYAINALKIKNELGWSPKVSFEDGLKETITWYIESNQREKKLYE